MKNHRKRKRWMNNKRKIKRRRNRTNQALKKPLHLEKRRYP